MLATLIYALALEPRTEAKEPVYTSKECVASDVRRTNKKGAGRLQEMEERRAAQSGEAKSEL